MIRSACLSLAILAGITASATAQVSVRVPFVQVEVGDPGVYVRAPFVRVWVPTGQPVYRVVPAQPAMPPAGQPLHQPRVVPVEPPAAAPDENAAAPKPIQTQHPTVEEFARNFQARPGNYDVTMINPVTKQPTSVRFTLPDGSPRRVIVNARELEFFYGLRKFVRIEFDQDGAQVVTR